LFHLPRPGRLSQNPKLRSFMIIVRKAEIVVRKAASQLAGHGANDSRTASRISCREKGFLTVRRAPSCSAMRK